MEHYYVVFMTLCFSMTICGSKGCDCYVDIPNGYAMCRFQAKGELYYSCDTGYERTTPPDQYPLQCLWSGWNPAPSCKRKACHDPIPNGAVASTCNTGSTCNYTCEPGFHAAQTSVTCDDSTRWAGNPHLLCYNEFQCPYEIENGYLNLTCNRRHRDTCHFTCAEYYKSSYKDMTVYCSSNQIWEPPLYSACTEILCPENIPNGRVHRSCSRRTRSGCSEFDCDSGYTIIVYPPSYRPIDYLCNTTGHWRWPKDTGPPCVKKPPPPEPCPLIENAELTPPCDRSPLAASSCHFTCNSGCYSSGMNYEIYCSMEDSSNFSSSSSWRSSSTRLEDDTISCVCKGATPYQEGFAAVGGVVGGIVFLGCIVGTICRRIRRKRARARNDTSDSIPQTRSIIPSRTVCDDNTATLQCEHRGAQNGHIDIRIRTHDTENNNERIAPMRNTGTVRPPSYSSMADIPPSYSAIEVIPPRYSATEEMHHSNNMAVGIPPSYSSTADLPLNYGTRAESNYTTVDTPPSHRATADSNNTTVETPPSYRATEESNRATVGTPPSYRAAISDSRARYRTTYQEPSGYCSTTTDSRVCMTETEAPPRYSVAMERPHISTIS